MEENFKVKHITKKEATKLYQNIHFCPAYYPHYNMGIKLIDGEIGCLGNIKYIVRRGEIMFRDIVEVDETIDYETVNLHLDNDWVLLKVVQELDGGFLYIIGRPFRVAKDV